jgi:signal transduction histidine kinase
MEVRQDSLSALETERLQIARLLSHDFRSPLTRILGLVQLMQLDRDPENSLQYLQKVQNAADSLDMHLINLRDYLRLERRLSELSTSTFTSVKILLLLQRWMKRYERNLEAKQIKWKWLTTEDLELQAYPDLTDDICRHLIHNALKFTPIGGQIEVRVVLPGSILIENDLMEGKIPDLSMIRQVFFPAHSMGSSGEPGIGLGLFLADALAEGIGAKLSLDIENGRFRAHLEFRV